MAAGLLIGPVLRRVVDTRATVWVETDAPALVTVRAEGGGAGAAKTFAAYGHHYALVIVEGLRPGRGRHVRGVRRRHEGLAASPTRRTPRR